MLGRLGYAAIVLEGQPKDKTLYKVFINKDGAQIKEDNSLCMLGNYDTVEKMKGEYGEKVHCISMARSVR
jgi:aldehyde:ferredoxin oxidoreductase